MLVAQQLERQMQPLDGFTLIFGVLCAEAKDSCAEGLQFLIMVSKCAGLRRAAACAGDFVPALR